MTQWAEMPRRLPKYCYEDVDRYGTVRIYLRRTGLRKVRLEGIPWSAEFMSAYASACGALPTKITTSVASETWAWLCQKYFASPSIKTLATRGQNIRRRILERTFDEPIAPGSTDLFRDFPLSLMGTPAIKVLRDRLAKTPEAANERLKAIRQVFAFGIETERATANPARDVAYIRRKTDGFYTWTLEDVEQYERHHGPGSKGRLALYLLLYVGPRRSDVVLLCRQMVVGGWIKFKPQKTRATSGAIVEVPILPVLQAELDLIPPNRMMFLETMHGAAFTANGFGNWFKRRCVEAGLPFCSAHGLRKAGAARAAENGATTYQLMAMYGWASPKQAEVYTRMAARKKLAGDGMNFLNNCPTKIQELPNKIQALGSKGEKCLKRV